jgi:hypothetical protein
MRTWLALGLAATGCIPRIETTHVLLIHTADVAVELETPTGPVTAMPQDAVRGEIPESAPPYIGNAERGSWVERNGGEIDAWCPQCATYRKRTLLERQYLDLAGSAYELLHFDGDQLRIRTDLPRSYTCGSKHPHTCTTPKLRLALVTPLANVESIRFDRMVDRDTGASTGAVFGLVIAAAGATLGGFGIADHEPALIGVGGTWMALGGTLFGILLAAVLASDQHISIVGGQSASTAVGFSMLSKDEADASRSR